MTLRSKALAGVAVVALLAGCGLFKSDKSEPQASSTSPSSSSTDIASNTAPATTPSANLPPMTKTSPVEGGTPATMETATPQVGAAPVAVALATVENPKTTLAHATVKDAKGEAIGEVKSVRVAKSGRVAAVNVAIGAKTYALKADTLTYIQAENTIISQKSKAEIAPGK